MRIFVSWSGSRSKLLATALRDWLKKVIQACEPWMSDTDIESGNRWGDAIAGQLRDISVGIACVTPENQNSPWINFEAGAISKTVEDAYICPYLFALRPTELTGPLAQFQARSADHAGTFRLVETINRNDALKSHLSDADLREIFDSLWPKLNEKIRGIPELESAPAPPRPMDDMLSETLRLVREIAQDRRQHLTPPILADGLPTISPKIIEIPALRALLEGGVSRLPPLVPSNYLNALKKKATKQLVQSFPNDDLLNLALSYVRDGDDEEGIKALSALTGTTLSDARGALVHLKLIARRAGIDLPMGADKAISG